MRKLILALLLTLTPLAAQAQVATNLVFDTKVAPNIPAPNQASLGSPWILSQANSYTTDASSNILTATSIVSPAALASRPGSGPGTSAVTPGTQENSLNQKATLTWTVQSITVSSSPAIILRSNGNASSLTAYELLTASNAGTVRLFTSVAGTATQIYVSGSTPYVVGHSYTMGLEVDQTNGTTTTYIVNLTDNTSSTAILTNVTGTNTTAALQNPATSGMGIDATGGGFAIPITDIQYYTDQTVTAPTAATGYTVTLGSTGTVGVPQSGTVAITGGTTLGSTLSVAMTPSNGSAISPNPVTIANGSTSSVFTYTPAAAGSETIAWSYSGGNASMTGNGSQTETIAVAPTLVTPLDANLFWTDGWLLSSSGAYANNAGNYLKMAFSGSSLAINFDVTNIRTGSVTTAEWPVILYSVDGGTEVRQLLADPGGNTLTLTLTSSLSGASTHTLRMMLLAETQAFNRWTINGSGFPPSGLRIASFNLSGGATVPLGGTYLALKPCMNYVYSDSIGEGAKTTYPSSVVAADAEATWTNAVNQALGCEYTNYSFSGQAWSGQLGVPDVPVLGSAWNLRFAGQTKLASGSFIRNSSLPLKYLLTNMGTNDAANHASTTAGSIRSVLTAMRAAAGSATVLLVMPFASHSTWYSAQSWNTFQVSEYAAYLATDPNAYLIDVGQDASTGLVSYPASSSNYYTADGLHPGGQRSGQLGAMLYQKILSAIPAASAVPQFQNRFQH